MIFGDQKKCMVYLKKLYLQCLWMNSKFSYKIKEKRFSFITDLKFFKSGQKYRRYNESNRINDFFLNFGLSYLDKKYFRYSCGL